jgi:bifunctional Delta-12/omega-3 fatty acid desaturase
MATTTKVQVAQELPRLRHGKLDTKQPLPDINTLRKAIPAHCFQPSAWRSLAYVARDLSMAGALVWAALTYIPQIPDPTARIACWGVYGFLQGLVGVGIWILAHECGHGAFSLHRRLNAIVGWALHSLLMVPFFSWKFSHARHHRFTGHMKKDMAFVPRERPQSPPSPRLLFGLIDMELLEDTPIYSLVSLIAHQLGGWQAYLLLNVSAGRESLQNKQAKWWRLSHFDPFSGVFRPSEALYIALSDLGLALTATGIYYGAQAVGWDTMFLLYAVPYFWVHHWLGKRIPLIAAGCGELTHCSGHHLSPPYAP